MFRILFTPDRKLLIKRRAEDDADSLPISHLTVDERKSEESYRFVMSGNECMAEERPHAIHIPGCRWIPLRQCRPMLPDWQFRAAAKGAELLYHDSISKYCGRCGSLLYRSDDGLSKHCKKCGLEIFPQVSPCVIVLVRRGAKALLVHARSFCGNHFGLIAGFIETGETAEECVVREVREETSLEICNVRYIGSQPWPFPANLMLAFTADYVSGELQFNDGELSSGDFFGADELPPLPPGTSIARLLIERWTRAQNDLRKTLQLSK